MNEAAAPRVRPPVSLPAGMSITEDGEDLVLARRWLRPKHFAFLVVIGALTVFAAIQWSKGESSTFLIVGTIFLASWNFQILKMFLNTSTIRAGEGRIDVRHGPFPSLVFKNQSLAKSDLRQLFAKKFGALYEVGAELQDGTKISLVRPLVSEEQALFVEQQLERHLGIVDVEVDGELGSSVGLPAEVPAAVSKGAGGAIALLPILIIGVTFAIFYSAASSDLTGTLEASGDRLGQFSFTPDDCSSGQTRGFFGVELRSSHSPGLVVRALRDPVRGTLIAVEHGGGQPVVLEPKECRSLSVQVDQTSTNINDVWVVEGSARIDCDELRGELTFAGCH